MGGKSGVASQHLTLNLRRRDALPPLSSTSWLRGAKIKVLVKRILRKHGYPPDKQEQATKTVLEQAELLCAEWAA